MNKQTVGYSESHESFDPSTGLKSWKKIWYDKEIDETADPTEAFKEAKALVNSWGNGGMEAKFNPYSHIHDPNMIPMGEPNYIPPTGTMPHVQPMPSIDRKAIDRLEKLIDDCDDLGELIKLEKLAVTYGLRTNFDNKLKQLQ